MKRTSDFVCAFQSLARTVIEGAKRLCGDLSKEEFINNESSHLFSQKFTISDLLPGVWPALQPNEKEKNVSPGKYKRGGTTP